jgi:hypothetical protein
VVTRKKERLPNTPEVGDEVTMRPWIGKDWLKVRVQKMIDSPVHGPGVQGFWIENGQAQATVTLPLSHMVEQGRAIKIGHGKWTVEMPDGKITNFKSKKSAEQFCQENNVVFTEVSS